MSKLTSLPKEDKKMLNSIFFRSFAVFAGGAGATKAGASGFFFSVMPALKRYYKKHDDFADAMTRHTTWYNITQNVGTFAMGLVASMEKENSENPDFDTQSIAAIKASLMGPMSGIGDAIFWGVIRVIAAGIGVNLAMQGSILGPVLFFLIYNIPSVLCRYYMTYLGYSLGSTFIEKIYSSGAMKIMTKAASTLGLMMVGAMAASNVRFNTIISMSVPEGEPIMLQTYLDSIFVGLVPLALTLLCLYLLRKNVNVNLVLAGVLVLAILLGIFGVV